VLHVEAVVVAGVEPMSNWRGDSDSAHIWTTGIFGHLGLSQGFLQPPISTTCTSIERPTPVPRPLTPTIDPCYRHISSTQRQFQRLQLTVSAHILVTGVLDSPGWGRCIRCYDTGALDPTPIYHDRSWTNDSAANARDGKYVPSMIGVSQLSSFLPGL
jgi:hypothetical protein